MSFRPYQHKAIEQIRAIYSQGQKRVMLHLATGAGKTVIFSHSMRQCAERGGRAVMVVRGRELVEQASQRLFKERVEHGVRMAGHWNRNYGARVQICSIDTLIARGQFPPADLVVIDEADQATSKGYHTLSDYYPRAFFLPVTATPYTAKSLKHIASEIVHPISMQELIDQGYLVPPRYFAPSAPNLEGVKIVNDEYQNAQVEERMGSLTGDIVAHWKKLVGGRPTVCFAVNIRHSIAITDSFRAQGVAAEHCDAETPDSERKEIIRRLENGTTQIVCNVGILGRGVDIPFLGCVIMARPTRSYNLYIQQAGRGTRTFPGKCDFIILDHASNVTRHGFITVEPPADLDGASFRKLASREIKVWICKVCYLAYQGADCPDCGPQVKNAINREIEHNEGNLQEIVAGNINPILVFLAQANEMRRKRGYKSGWVYHQLIKRFGMDVAQPHLPDWFLERVNDPFFNSPYKEVK